MMFRVVYFSNVTLPQKGVGIRVRCAISQAKTKGKLV